MDERKNFKMGRKTRVAFRCLETKIQLEERSFRCLHLVNTDKAIISMLHDSERSVLHFGGFGGDGIECKMQAQGETARERDLSGKQFSMHGNLCSG